MRGLSFRHLAGVGCLCAAVLFLCIDSNILARGAARYAVSEWDKWSYGAIAFTVPWIISIMPFLFAITWKPGKYIGRPSMWTLCIAAVWIAFVAYNVFGAGGSISFTRTDVISARKFEASRERDTTKRREALQAQLDEIAPATRASAAVKGLMGAERAKVTWVQTDQCKDARNSRERKFCEQYQKLAAELGQAEAREKIMSELGRIDDARAVAGWVAEVVDPTARFWSRITGWSEIDVQDWAPLATPIVLQLGSWVFLSFALILLGFTGHKDALFGSRPVHAYAAQGGGSQPAPAPAANSFRRPVTATQFVSEWFAEHVRPVAQGALEEEKWYAFYSKECSLSGIVPVEIEVFRDVARKHGAAVTVVDGKFYYQRVMPLVQGAA